jgi:hypothetical protein
LHPVYLRNIGRCHQKMRDPVKAIDAFRDYLGKSKNIAADERTEIEGYIKEMEDLKKQRETPPPPPPKPPDPPPAWARTMTSARRMDRQFPSAGPGGTPR